jgi:predicted transcriptional regulator
MRFLPLFPVKSIEPKKHPDICCVVMGRELRELRESLGLSLEETALRAGVSRQTGR